MDTPQRARAWPQIGFVLLVSTAHLVWQDPWRSGSEVAVYGLGAVSVVHGVRRYQPRAVPAWGALAAALALFALSSAVEALSSVQSMTSVALDAEAGLDVLGYALLAIAGIASVVTGGAHRDRHNWLDILSLALVVGLAAVVWADDPLTTTAASRELAVGVPLMTGVVLIIGLRLALPGEGRSYSGAALLCAGGLALAGYVGKIGQLVPPVALLVDVLPLLAVVGVLLAAASPSMAQVGHPRTKTAPLTGSGLLGMAASLLISPVLVVVWGFRHGINVYVLASGLAGLTGLTLWRVATLLNDGERDRLELHRSRARLDALLHYAADVIAIVGADGRINYVNPAVTDLLGEDPDHWIGRRAIALVQREEQGHLRDWWRDDAPKGGPRRIDVRLRHRDGQPCWVELSLSDAVYVAGVDGWVVNVRNIAHRKAAEQLLHRQATTDALTGVLNRAQLIHELAHPTQAVHSLLFVDLDGFKAVNDTLGHRAGDEVLKQVADRIASCVPATGTIARLGGDEFAVLLRESDQAAAVAAAHRILVNLRVPLTAGRTPVRVTASIGIVMTTAGESPAAALHRADSAMYAAKRAGKNAVRVQE